MQFFPSIQDSRFAKADWEAEFYTVNELGGAARRGAKPLAESTRQRAHRDQQRGRFVINPDKEKYVEVAR
ncbi:hypothetical protein [Paraburkholderia fungorum]|uniref:Uncharacterized protein n=1 Tax=Paraburkholderia fungorum TaxID=134537 RepID=A0AAW3V1H7_9BURK|nr:hypothetical protein [Paraburkholderia fungorum]MBB4515842.1 hypothetical protein [Paraburkholderia fungorum]MBB6203742.1 hypothetical protein [Paraburkholderia fungorum]